MSSSILGDVKMNLKTCLMIFMLFFSTISQTPHASSEETASIYEMSITMVYTNRGYRSVELEPWEITWNIFMNNSWQNTFLLDVNLPYTESFDADDNPIIVIDAPAIQPNENVTINVRFKIIENERAPPLLNLTSLGTLDSIPKELVEQYCTPSGTWQTNLSVLRNLADSIWSSVDNSRNVLEIATAIAKWIRGHISTPKFNNHMYPWYPNETYYGSEGDCDDQANLFITLCRLLNIPAYLQVGCLYDPIADYVKETYLDGHVTTVARCVSYHGWAVVFIPPWGWLNFDLTMGQPKSNSVAPFAGITSAPVYSKTTIQLLNITKSDWAGDARVQIRDKESQLYVYEEDVLNLITNETPLPNIASDLLPIIATVVIAITALGAFGIDLVFKRYVMRKRPF